MAFSHKLGDYIDEPKPTCDPDTATPFPIKSWVVVSDDTLFIGSSNSLIYGTTNSGLTYSSKAVAGEQSINSLSLSPSYATDETILAGNKNGWVYWSRDNGISFEPLPQDATSAPLTGKITVAFDPNYSHNSTVYSASDTPDKGIYRFVTGTSTKWESIDGTLPSGGKIDQLAVSAQGALYATNFQETDIVKGLGGMERCLNPAYQGEPIFETANCGLDDGATLIGLWLCADQLWSIDSTNVKLMTFTDSLATPVSLTSPPHQSPGAGTITGSTIRNVNLDWESLNGATSYHWQLDYNANFSTVPIPLEGDAEVSSTRLSALEPTTTYYWRVRVTEPLLSPWSANWSFTTSLGTSPVAPHLRTPGAGAKHVNLKPIFQWSAITGADSYELLVSKNVYFANPTIERTGTYALPSTAWQSDTELSYATTYYWKVRAISSTSHSVWSAVSAFTTGALPEEPEPLPFNLTAPALNIPEGGASGVGLKPIFQWSAITGADSYELLVSEDVYFADPAIEKLGDYALPSTAWRSDTELSYTTTYYWKVRAISSTSHSAWSATSAFTTGALPEEAGPSLPLPQTSDQTIIYSPTPDWVQWLMYLGGALLLAMVVILITMVILMVRQNPYK